MTLSRRRFAAAAVGVGLAPILRVAAQDALDAIPAGPLRDQIEWIISLLDDPQAVLTEDEVAEHFNEMFLSQVPATEVVMLFEQLRGQLRGVTITGIEPGPVETEAVVDMVGRTGVALRMTVAVEPDSGLISGLLLQPGEAPEEPATAVAATPAASPVAVAPPPSTDEILADYQAASDALRDAGRAITEAFVSGDDETFKAMLDPEAAALLAGFSVEDAMAELTTDIVSFSLAEVSAFFAGHYTPEGISGMYHQGTPAAFQLSPEEAQDAGYPTGTWSGEILIGTFTLGVDVTFSGTADDLSATISIPEQFLFDHPLTDVRFEVERPLGELVDERALPMGPLTGTSSYGASYAWGDVTVAVNSAFNEDNEGIAISAVMQPLLPPDPAAGVDVTTAFRLPFEGAWMVIWGGDSEFRNYHAPVPQQRYAHDIVIWRDGATYTGDGTRNEQYHCYGQPQVAPAAGTVVTVVDEYPDDTPGVSAATDQTTHPAGNHVVIEVAESEYVLMAHFQPGTIAVAAGQSLVAGDLIGLTGNSGNSSEPHIHIHMQTGPDMLDPATIGLPMTFSDLLVNGEPAEIAMIEQGQIIEPA